MQGAATLLQHPIHPMLVVFPLAFLIGSSGGDLLFVLTRRPFWERSAFALIGFGLIGGLAAAVPGLVDYFTAPMGADAKDVATDHMIANGTAWGLFLVSFVIRWRRPRLWFKYVLSLGGVCVLLYAGYLGGHLVYMHHVGVTSTIHEHHEHHEHGD